MTAPGKRGYICKHCGKVRRAANPHAVNAGNGSWPKCCSVPMALMGHRQAQAAALLDPAKRLDWMRLGAFIKKGNGHRKWRPIMSEGQKRNAHYLP